MDAIVVVATRGGEKPRSRAKAEKKNVHKIARHAASLSPTFLSAIHAIHPVGDRPTNLGLGFSDRHCFILSHRLPLDRAAV